MSNSRAVRTVVVVRPPHPEERTSPSGLLTVETTASGASIIDAGTTPFTFPTVYGFQGRDLDTLCSNEVESLVSGVFNGESAAVISYGQTGAGKSYLSGTEFQMKAWPNSVGAYVSRRIWEIAQERGAADLSVECSFIEICRKGNEQEVIHDLLGGFNRVPIAGYGSGTSHTVSSAAELLDKLREGSGLRNTDATNGNARSSRSHAIFFIQMQYTLRDTSTGASQRVSGKLLLVDLAGAEGASAAVNKDQQSQGSGNNRGLLTLNQVIREVAEVGKTLRYRDSKLTYFLKPALGGEGGREGCNALFLGCVSPSLANADKTDKTLKYVQQAGKICNKVEANVEALEARREAALSKQNEKLKRQLEATAAELRAAREALAGGGAKASTPSRPSSARRPSSAGVGGGGAAAGADVSPSKPPWSSLTDVVILSVAEHRALLEELSRHKDASAALEGVVARDQERHERLQAEVEAAQARAAAAEERAQSAHKRQNEHREEEDAGNGGEFSFATPLVAGDSLGLAEDTQASGEINEAGATPSLPHSALHYPSAPRTAPSPALAALAVSPILSAARLVDSASRDKPPSALAAGGSGEEDRLTLDDICLSGEDSHLDPDQMAALKAVVQSRLDAAEKERSGGAGGGPVSAAADIAALRLAVTAYNECLGTLGGELALARDREAEALAGLHQAAREKVQYVDLVAKYQMALDMTQFDVVELQSEVNDLRRLSLASQSTPNTAGSSPGKGLLGRLMARATGGWTPEQTPRTHQTSDQAPQIVRMGEGGGVEGERGGSGAATPRSSNPQGLSSPKRRQEDAGAAVTGTAVAVVETGGAGAGESGGGHPAEEELQPIQHNDGGIGSTYGTPRSDHYSMDPASGYDFEDEAKEGGGGAEAGQQQQLPSFPLGDVLSDEESENDEPLADGEVAVVNLRRSTSGSGSGNYSSAAEAAAAVMAAAPRRRALLSNSVVAVTRQDRELMKRMHGGVDVKAISTGRYLGQLSEDFVQQNQHWAPLQKNNSRGR